VLLVDVTLDDPAENLALDEALLDQAERAGPNGEVLRIWEPAARLVVVGRSSRIEGEVHRPFCRHQSIPILRRSSGGAAIVTGPGCLMYAVVLDCRRRPHLRSIDLAHRFVLGRLAAVLDEALRTHGPPGVDLGVVHRGTSDLVVGGRKFSGNSMRVKRDHVLYHGTLLYGFPLELVGQCLRMPPRQPEYRDGREHREFLANVPLAAGALREALAAAFEAVRAADAWPREAVRELVRMKYGRREWNEQL
jgi:lipoate---protein ligase